MWPAPENVRSLITTRRVAEQNPSQEACYNSFNLGFHVGDDPQIVRNNWQVLVSWARLPETPRLVRQVHGVQVVDSSELQSGLQADGVYTQQPGHCCTILTADCLPILLCNAGGTEVATLHAGWRGLASGVVASGVGRFSSPPEQLLAFLGPAISQLHFEVGSDVRDAFLANAIAWGNAGLIAGCFRAAANNRWYADLYQLARMALNAVGVTSVFGGGECTFSDKARFFSYRRDGVTGRMASIIWID